MVLRLGIIGLGYWGKHYVRLITNNTRTKLTAICDLSEEALKKYDHLSVKKYTNSDEMLNSGLIDGVVIVTIARTHKKLIENALSCHLKVFVEKPYTLNVEDCLHLNKLENGHNLMIGHTYLFNSKVDFVKDYISMNMNSVKTVHFEWTCYGPIRQDTTPIFDLAVHPISILCYLFPHNKMSNLNSLASKSGHTYLINFTFGEVIVSMNISWSSPGKTRKMTINNDDIKIVFDDVSNVEPVKIMYVNKPSYNDSYQNMIFKDGNTVIPQIKNCEPLGDQLDHWLDVIDGKEKCMSNKIFATKVVSIAELIELNAN